MATTPQLEKLKQLFEEYQRFKHPSTRTVNFPSEFKKSKTTNGITQLFIWYVKLNGWMAERTGTAGRMVKTKNGLQYIPGTSTKGSSDIKCIINQKGVYVEIKNKYTKDSQGKKQKEYQKKIEMAGGVYYICPCIEDGIDWFDENFERNPDYLATWQYYKELGQKIKWT